MARLPKPPIRPETRIVEAFLRRDRPFLAAIVALAHSPWAIACFSSGGLLATLTIVWLRLK